MQLICKYCRTPAYRQAVTTTEDGRLDTSEVMCYGAQCLDELEAAIEQGHKGLDRPEEFVLVDVNGNEVEL